MLQIVRFVEQDVDGCGTDVEAMVWVETDADLCSGYTERLEQAVAETKRELVDEWSTDELIDGAMKRVFGDDVKCGGIWADIEVVF